MIVWNSAVLTVDSFKATIYFHWVIMFQPINAHNCHLIHNNIFINIKLLHVQTLLVHRQGVHYLVVYKTVTKQYFDLLHIWKNWWDSYMWTECV